MQKHCKKIGEMLQQKQAVKQMVCEHNPQVSKACEKEGKR